ncbi:MAG: hypothetical protein PHO41_06760 [Eubacteriales bacterium]|nr:hypothetical protein [Eubacteriales bacterium]
MKKSIAGLLAVCITLVFTGCAKPQQQEAAKATPIPTPTPEAAIEKDPENPVKLFVDLFNAASVEANAAADAAAGEAHTLLPELLAAQGHVYALQRLLYGPTNLLYTSENLFDGGIYGLLHGTGSVWQTDEEISFSCTLGSGDTVRGTLKDGVLNVRQTKEIPSEAETETPEEEEATVEEQPPTEQLIAGGCIVQREDGWYSYYYEGSDTVPSMLYLGDDRLVFTRFADVDISTATAWLDTPPEQWGETSLIAEGDTVRLYTREVTEETDITE